MEKKNELDNCLKTGLLKTVFPSPISVKKSLIQANFFLKEASDLIDNSKKEMAMLALYNAAFHAARAILFLDGIKEKSHYCLQKYLEAKAEQTNIVLPADAELFDNLRTMRQEVQYDLSKFVFEEDLVELYNQTLDFIERVKKIVEKS